MQGSNSVFKEACRMVGECCLMLARNGEEISCGRIAIWLGRAQEEAQGKNGKRNDALQLAIERLNGW